MKNAGPSAPTLQPKALEKINKQADMKNGEEQATESRKTGPESRKKVSTFQAFLCSESCIIYKFAFI